MLSEEAELSLFWMRKGYTMYWQGNGRLKVGPLVVYQEAKDELLNAGLIREQTTFHITPAGREAYEASQQENDDE